MSTKHKLVLIILAMFISGALIVTSCTSGGGLSCTAAISRGWAGGAVYNGDLFVVSMNGKIIAIDASNNAILGNPVQLSVTSSSGLLGCAPSSSPLVIYASPIVLNVADLGMVVYVGGMDGKIHGFLFKDNTLVEKNPSFLSDQLKGQIVGGIIADKDTLYFATSDGTVYTLNAKDLTVKWSHKINSKIWSAPAVNGSTLYIGCFNKTVYALNTADGTEKWKYETSGAINSTPVVYNNTVYIGDYDRHFYALDAANGNLVWKFPQDGKATDNPQNWFWAKPVVLNGVIYAPCLDGNLYALDASNGNLVKKYELGNSIVSSPLVIGNSIVVATSVASTNVKQQRGKVYIINTVDGSHQEFDLPPMEDINAPLFAQGSIVYVHTNKDDLYSIDTAVKDSQLKLLFYLSAVK